MNDNVPESFQWNEGEDNDIFDMLNVQKEETCIIHACRNTINARYRLLYKRRNANIEFPSLSVEHVGAIVKNTVRDSPSSILHSLMVNGIVTEVQYRLEYNQPETDNYVSDIVVPFPYRFPISSPLSEKYFHISGYNIYSVRSTRDLYKMKRNLLEKGPILGIFFIYPHEYEKHDHRTVFTLPKPIYERSMKTHAVTITGYRHEFGHLIWRFQNSMGPNWGNHGFGEIIHDYMLEMYEPIVELDDDEPNVVQGV